MRIGIVVDYGKYANASSLNLLAKKIFLELGKIMNKNKTFTISALKNESIGIGDINQHYDFISIPNMGGYKFPHKGILTANNIGIGLIGIDEVVLGEQVYRTKMDWKINKPIIDQEVPKWEKHIDKIKFIHVSTNSEKDQMIKYLKIPESKIYVIPLGVDHEIFRPAVNKKEIRKKILGRFFLKDSPYFIHISEANWARKNVLRVLEAFRKAKTDGIIHNLIIVGRTDPIIYEKARSIDGVMVLGYLSEDDLVLLMQGADALIFPSLHEGFGLPLVEAMACGVPAITSNVFSPPEVVGESGLLVDPYDVPDITNKMIEMSRNQALQNTLSEKAVKRSQQFSWERTASNLLGLIEQNTENDQNNFDFAENYNMSAYRTLTTICEITPTLNEISQSSLLQFDYSRIIPWALEVGLKNPNVSDFLIPFKEWLISYDS